MGQVTLAIRGLRDEQMLLRQGGVYWLSIDQASDAEILGRQFLGALVYLRSATLICCAQDGGTVVAALKEHLGPAELRLFDVPEAKATLALKSLPLELTRAGVPSGSQIVLLVPVASWQGFSTLHVQRWCDSMANWLAQRACTLLVLCHGQAPQLHAQLIRINEHLSGLAQLYRSDDGIRYQLYYWHSHLGVCSAQTFELAALGDGFALAQAEGPSQQRVHSDDDERVCLTLRSVLEGAAPLSPHWHLLDSHDDLLARARGARAASVIVGITSHQQVEGLAQQLHELRNHCGASLKIIVRELVPCLRYCDERLLVLCGANIAVPHGTSLACFFSLVDSVQGQTWQHSQTADFNVLIERLSPPLERGLLSPQRFICVLDQIQEGAGAAVSHQLLKLLPRNGLSVEQYLSQIDLRRFGDMACVLDGAFYLFVFACRADALEPALASICRLPWRVLFSDCQSFAGVDGLQRQAFLDATLTPPGLHLAMPSRDSGPVASTRHNAYMPQRTRLPVTEYCP